MSRALTAADGSIYARIHDSGGGDQIIMCERTAQQKGRYYAGSNVTVDERGYQVGKGNLLAGLVPIPRN